LAGFRNDFLVVELKRLFILRKTKIELISNYIKYGLLKAGGIKRPINAWSVAIYIRKSWLFFPELVVLT